VIAFGTGGTVDGVDAEFVEITAVAEGSTTAWRFDRAFLESNWTCIFGRGCQGILSETAPELNQGCCSIGADLGDDAAGHAEAMNLSAYAATLTADEWQHHGVDSIFRDERRDHTRVVDGACVFLNRPGFEGGEGCALHIAAESAGESPVDWKPSVCWQLPIRVDWEPVDDTSERATVRRWARGDWGDQGTTMAWCCTERGDGGEAYSGSQRVVDSMAEELTAVVGREVYVELVTRLAD
jgi:hypothetical protein